jgi:pimeloyl-ACP methyl ester carboxylesterase
VPRGSRRRLASLASALLPVAWCVAYRRSPVVRTWRPGAGSRRRAGPLSVRTAGTGERVIVLLHGLPASGRTFGAGFDPLAEHGQLVIPDLLGFGRSQDAERTDFSLHKHLDALDAMLDDLGLGSRPLVVAGHSMGGLLAWQWAARRADQVEAVITWCAPLFADRADAARRLNRKAPGLAWLGLPGPVSRTVCQQLCTRRPQLTQWLYALLYPRVPVALSRQLTDHTWSSYAPAMTEIVLDRTGTRSRALRRLEHAGVPVLHAVAARDVLAPPEAMQVLGQDATALTVRTHPAGNHLLPLADPEWCVQVLAEALTDAARD